MWDRDTEVQETVVRVDVIETTVGWFDRYPALFYEMRLARVSAELARQPDRLDDYDDAGVACARLGKPDEAIQWMRRKAEILKTVPDSQHEYRYLANLGTFYLQRWAMQKPRPRSLYDLDDAIRLIKQALVVNPPAHFGREHAQLRLMEWLRAGGASDDHSTMRPANIPVWMANSQVGDWPRALQGLIRQGIAWESVDVFNWLSTTMGPELNYLVTLRSGELLKAGVPPLQADPAYLGTWAELDKSGRTQQALAALHDTGAPEARKVESFFQRARDAADKRHEALTTFMNAKLKNGIHPDTHSDFWKDWKSPVSMPVLSFLSWVGKIIQDGGIVGQALLYLGALCLAALLSWYLVMGLRRLADLIMG